MKTPRRAARRAGLHLAGVTTLLALALVWWQGAKEPDYRQGRRLLLAPEGARQTQRVVLEEQARLAFELAGGEALRCAAIVPGAEAVLVLRAGAAPSGGQALSVALRLGRAGQPLEELARWPLTPRWQEFRQPLPVTPGEDITLEFVVAGPAGALALLCEPVLLSAGRGVDETEAALLTRTQTDDLLARMGHARVFAPPSPERARAGLAGPACIALSPASPLQLRAQALVLGSQLEVTLLAARPHPEGASTPARVLLTVDGQPQAVIPVDLSAHTAPVDVETLTAIDLSPWAGRSVDLSLQREGGDNLFVGVRDLTVSAPQRVPRRAYDPEHTLNVLLVTVESLRADRLGSYGYARGATPTLDALAGRGGRWERVLAPSSWNLPNLASLLTGVSPLTHGLGLAEARTLTPRRPTLAETAAWSGVTTALFAAGHALDESTGLARGFETVRRGDLPADVLVEEALAWLEEAQQYRWFLMLHLADPAAPHEPRSSDLRRVKSEPSLALVESLRRLDSRPGVAEALAVELGPLYDAEVAGVDRALAALFAGLSQRGLLERTLVVVVGVMGEEFYEHGGRWHGQTLHEEVLAVPLLAAGPGVRGPDGRAFVVQEPIELVDVTRLLAKLGRLASPEQLQGRLPPPYGPTLPDPVAHAVLRPVPGITGVTLDASRSRRWLRLADPLRQRVSLFDLQSDPLAQQDLLAAREGLNTGRAAAEVRLQENSLAASFERWRHGALSTAGAQPTPQPAVSP
ncbi:MAG: sulfatase-like hydrolase/transferase [Planctomycetota bacterium]